MVETGCELVWTGLYSLCTQKRYKIYYICIATVFVGKSGVNEVVVVGIKVHAVVNAVVNG